jgi:hypothetical protein
VEIVLGLMLLVGVPLFITLIVGGSIALLLEPHDAMFNLLVIVMGSVLAPFCAVTGWRLVAGRERPGGGLFNPLIVDSLTVVFGLVSAARTSLWFGPELARRESEEAAEALGRVRAHWRKRPTSTVSVLRYVTWSLFSVLGIVMAYGFYRFPAAPFHYVNGHYVDKRGGTHSRQEFEDLGRWERIFITSWVASASSAIALQLVKRRTERH